MKSLASILFLALFSCCGESTEEKFFRECPYKSEYVGAFHQLQCPVNVLPHKLKYKVGETLSFRIEMQDSIHDLNTGQNFRIENFPFKPVMVLYRFYEENKWDDGLLKVNYKIDSTQFIGFGSNGGRPMVAFLKYSYINNKHYLNIDFTLTHSGRFIFQIGDNVNSLRPDSEEGKNLKEFNFVGKCPTFGYFPCHTIVGDDQLAYFEKELLHIDKVDYLDNWRSNKYENSWESPYGSGSFDWELNATFGFEVE